MSDRYVLAADGATPVYEPDLTKWSKLFDNDAARIVAQTQVSPDVQVSTVFLAIDHNFARTGAPVLWETMIFGGPHDGYQRRYISRQDAVAGHEAAVIVARATKD